MVIALARTLRTQLIFIEQIYCWLGVLARLGLLVGDYDYGYNRSQFHEGILLALNWSEEIIFSYPSHGLSASQRLGKPQAQPEHTLIEVATAV